MAQNKYLTLTLTLTLISKQMSQKTNLTLTLNLNLILTLTPTLKHCYGLTGVHTSGSGSHDPRDHSPGLDPSCNGQVSCAH